jgi:predicted PolB exonuclease-like 3'-5' exonuclease
VPDVIASTERSRVARSFRADYLILDIETVPDVERWQRPAAAPGQEALQPQFPPIWAHRIIVIGCLLLDPSYRLKRLGVIDGPAGVRSDAQRRDVSIAAATGSADERERSLLTELTRWVGNDHPVLVTYNGRSFDLPVIAMRALCHAVPLGWYYRDKAVRSRYSGERHVDICDWLADHGAIRAGKLDQVARLIGLPGKLGIDGSQVEGLFAAGQLDAIENYCLADVAQTALLFLRFRLLQGALPPELYRERVAELLTALGADGRVLAVLDGLDRPRLLGPELTSEVSF